MASNPSESSASIIIDNIPTKLCSTAKLKQYFRNNRKSGISSVKDIVIVNQNRAILCLENEEGM